MKKVVVIGAGPGGMMAAIKAAECGAAVTLLEKMHRPGRKMMITGKGRCNITNAADVQEIIRNIYGNGRFLMSSIHAFDNRDVIAFFEGEGVSTKVERGNRVFPVSEKAQDVVDAMVSRLYETGVKLVTDAAFNDVITAEGKVLGAKTEDGKTYEADAVILATGGASYPKTGSTGDGYQIARKLGHTVTEILPSLVPLVTEEDWVKSVQGLSLRNVRGTLLAGGKKVQDMFGEMMFTHFGITGPIVLSMSRAAAKLLAAGAFLEFELNLKPALTPEQLDMRIKRDFEKYQRKSLKNALVDLLPHKLIPVVLDYAFLSEELPVDQLKAEERRRIRDTLQVLSLTIVKTRPLAEAIVTSGGVSTKEIDPKTMESKLVRGLYFAGEVVDVDAYTGGYNLQAAFSMGAAAGAYSAQSEG